MPTRESGDPFDVVSDGDRIRIPQGVFRAKAPEKTAQGKAASDSSVSVFEPIRTASKEQKRSWLTVGILLLLLAVVVPAGISTFGSIRSEQLQAQQKEALMPTVVVISPEAQQLENAIRPINTAYIMSSPVTDKGTADELGALIAKVREQINANDVQNGNATVEQIRAYFMGTYAPSLAGSIPGRITEFSGLYFQTEERLRQLQNTVNEKTVAGDLDAVVAAVIEIPQQLAKARAEHTGEYVPFGDTSGGGDSGESDAKETEGSTPAETDAPDETAAPSETGGSFQDDDNEADKNNNGNNGTGNGNGGGDGNSDGNDKDKDKDKDDQGFGDDRNN